MKTGSRGPGVGKAASSGDAGGRGNNAGRGRGRGRGRGGGRGGGPGGRSSGKTDGRGAGFKKPEKEEDLDQGLDECEQQQHRPKLFRLSLEREGEKTWDRKDGLVWTKRCLERCIAIPTVANVKKGPGS